MPNFYNFPLLKTGERPDASGRVANITLDVLEELKGSYNPEELYEAQVVIGHEEDLAAIPRSDRAPSYGQIKRLRIVPDKKDEGEFVLEGIVDVIDEADDWIKRKLYNHRSLAYYEPGNEYSPDPDTYYIRHVALLGSQPPAIKDLDKVVRYSEGLTNMVTAFQEGEELQKEVQAPGENASPEELKAFLDQNAVAFFTEVLTSGERGFAGEIIGFDPAPSAENNYLYNPENGVYSGKFIDEEDEVFLFEFDNNSKSFIPEIQVEEGEEEVEDTNLTTEETTAVEAVEESAADQAVQDEDFLASFKEGTYKYKSGDKIFLIEAKSTEEVDEEMVEGQMIAFEEAVMAPEEEEEEVMLDPAIEEVVEQVVEEDEEVVALREQLRLQGEELTALREDKKKKRRAELKGFASKVFSEGKLLKTEVSEDSLVELMVALDESEEMRAFGEGKKAPLVILQTILDTVAPKLPMEGMTTLSEGQSEVVTPELEIPRDHVVDSDQALLHSKAKKLAKEKGTTFMKALSEILMTEG